MFWALSGTWLFLYKEKNKSHFFSLFWVKIFLTTFYFLQSFIEFFSPKVRLGLSHTDSLGYGSCLDFLLWGFCAPLFSRPNKSKRFYQKERQQVPAHFIHRPTFSSGLENSWRYNSIKSSHLPGYFIFWIFFVTFQYFLIDINMLFIRHLFS